MPPRVCDVPGRHDAPSRGRDGWAPTALDAVAACTPATSLFTALGLAGGGYLTGREGIAACGAVVGAVGLVVERLQSRGLRLRLRRERLRHRDDLRGIGRDVDGLQRELARLRQDLDGVRSEPARPAVPSAVPVVLARVPSSAGRAPVAVGGSDGSDWETEELFLPEVLPGALPGTTPPAVRPAARFVLPGQLRSPLATGGIPVLPAGPHRPVRIVDLRGTGNTGAIPLPAGSLPAGSLPAGSLPAGAADELVYDALDDEQADELARLLEEPARRAARHTGPLHLGDAYHAGDWSRDDAAHRTEPVLYVADPGCHVA